MVRLQSGDLKFTLDPLGDASANDFFEAGSRLLDLLDSLADEPINWSISDLQKSSAVVVISPEISAIGEVRTREIGIQAIKNVVDGLVEIEKGIEPDRWSPESISIAKRFVQPLQPRDGKLRSILEITGIEVDRRFIEITDHLVSQVNALTLNERMLHGSVRGGLVGFSVSRGNRASLRLPNGSIVQVKFANKLQESMRDNLLYYVELEGVLKKNFEDRVFWINAESIARLNPVTSDDLVNLFGSIPDITQGLSVADYLKKIRS